MNVSRETGVRLEQYEDLLRHCNSRINLIAPSTVSDIRQRHIEDCLQLARICPASKGTWLDIGSGGGLPGLILAIAKADSDLKFTLIESDQRKATFLRTVIRELALTNCRVIAKRIEGVEPLNTDYISARALAPLPRLMAYLDHHLSKDGQAWLMKGQQWQTEIEDARADWTFTCEAFPSETQQGAAILKISGLSHG